MSRRSCHAGFSSREEAPPRAAFGRPLSPPPEPREAPPGVRRGAPLPVGPPPRPATPPRPAAPPRGAPALPLPAEPRPAPEPRSSRAPPDPRRGDVMTSEYLFDWRRTSAGHRRQYRTQTRTGVRARGSDPRSVMVVRRRPTLPPRLQGSTIGAERLSFRVRNGTGRFPLAMTAVTL